MVFQIGDKVIHTAHGLGEIVNIDLQIATWFVRLN
jgi:RNA polymerase-interacting CarD/CdnL/TRCF family regulator